MPTGFWNSAQSEPRRAHRFLLNIPNLISGDGGVGPTDTYEQYLCRTVTKPAYTVSEVEHKFLGNTYYYPGAVTWDPVTVQLVNAVTPDGNRLLFEALYQSGHLDPDQQNRVFNGTVDDLPGTLNKASAVATYGDILIRELDGFGNFVGTWKMYNSFITNAKFGDLDYGSEELLNIDITFRYDYAKYASGRLSPDDVSVPKAKAIPR